jgi:hypothetical protein
VTESAVTVSANCVDVAVGDDADQAAFPGLDLGMIEGGTG